MAGRSILSSLPRLLPPSHHPIPSCNLSPRSIPQRKTNRRAKLMVFKWKWSHEKKDRHRYPEGTNGPLRNEKRRHRAGSCRRRKCPRCSVVLHQIIGRAVHSKQGKRDKGLMREGNLKRCDSRGSHATSHVQGQAIMILKMLQRGARFPKKRSHLAAVPSCFALAS